MTAPIYLVGFIFKDQIHIAVILIQEIFKGKE